MADIRLAKPVAGTTQTVPSAPDGRFIFDFPADAATLTRNGDDLVLSFEDGSSIRLQGFYTTYSKEDMPSFQVEGVEISGQDFFAALGEDLMPAAGPAAGSSASRGGRYNEYGGSDLLDGIDHLGRLDIGFDGGTQLATDTVEPSAPEVGAINERVKETTTVKLSVTPEDVMEGEAITYTATLVDENGNAVVNKGGDIIVSLGNGETIVIASGESSGTSAPVPTREDEAYVQGKETVSNQITDVSQDEGTSNFEHLVADETLVEVVVKDDNDTTTVSIATSDVLEGSESVVFDIQLSNKPDPSYEGATTVQVKVGETIYDVTVDADGRGTLTVPNPNGEDAYKDGSSITATVTGVTGGNYEKVEAGQSATANITDTVDTTAVTLSATAVVDGQYSLTVTVDNAPKSDLVLTLSNNQTITIEAGKTSATESYDYVPGQSMAISVTGVAGQTDANQDGKISYEEAGEGFYETLDFSGASVNLDIQAGGTVTSDDDDTKDDGIGQHEVIIQDSSVGTISQFAGGAGSVAVFQGENKIGELSIIDGKLFFTQTASYSHAEGEDSAVISQDVTVINASGAECELSIAITIEDSLPVAHADRLELETDRKAEGNLLSNDEESADGDTVVHSVTFNDTTEIFDSENNSITLDGRYGSLTVSADGKYTYTLKDDMKIPEAGTVSETFSYDIIDGDGDVSTASATLTILIGKGTLHVKESKTTINEYGQEIVIDGDLEDEKSLNARITSVTADEDSIKYDYDLPELKELTFGEYKEITGTSGYDHVYETNYGNLYVNEVTGAYRFVLDDVMADPLPEGFEISMSFTMTTVDDNGTPGYQNIVVVIEGTNDQGTLTEAGESGHASNQMWLDVKAAGTNTTEDPYDAVKDPNLGTMPNPDNPGEPTTNDDLGSDTTSRVVTWLPFTLEDVDLDESVTFKAVYNGAYHKDPGAANMNGQSLQTYVDFLTEHPSTEYSVALSVAWHEFTQKFTANQLENMLFYKTEGGIFVIVNDAVKVDGTGMDTAQNWLAFIADSDSDALRHMSEGSTTGFENGIIYKFSFQVRDSNGEIIRTTVTNEAGNITGYADKNNVLIHLYGSNDTPTMEISGGGSLVIHDDDVSRYQSSEVTDGGKATIDTEQHKIQILYDDKQFTGTLGQGTVKLKHGNEELYVSTALDSSDGTRYTLNSITDDKWNGLNRTHFIINGQFL